MTDQTHCNSCEKKLSGNDLNSDGYGPGNILLCARCRKLSAGQKRRRGWLPIMQWEDGIEGLRLASTAPVPWANQNVVIIHITHSGMIQVSHTKTGKRRTLERAAPDDMLLVAWPGNRRQDIFIVNNRTAALGALA